MSSQVDSTPVADATDSLSPRPTSVLAGFWRAPPLPLEIYFNVIEHAGVEWDFVDDPVRVEDAYRDLRNFSLVNKTWAKAAQRVLFGFPVILEKGSRLERLILACESSPKLARYVDTAIIQEIRLPEPSPLYFGPRLIGELLRCCPNLQLLELSDAHSLQETRSTPIYWSRDLFTDSMRELRLSCCRLEDQFPTHLTPLTCLILSNCAMVGSERQNTAIKLPLSCLPALERLVVRKSPISNANEFIQTLGSQIRCLVADDNFLDRVNQKSFQHLESLNGLTLDMTFDKVVMYLRWLPAPQLLRDLIIYSGPHLWHLPSNIMALRRLNMILRDPDYLKRLMHFAIRHSCSDRCGDADICDSHQFIDLEETCSEEGIVFMYKNFHHPSRDVLADSVGVGAARILFDAL